KRQGLKGFFKNLFRKKDKAADSTEIAPPVEEEFDFIDVDTATQTSFVQPEPEKGFFSPRQNQATEQELNEPAQQRQKRRASNDALKEEDNDAEGPADGF